MEGKGAEGVEGVKLKGGGGADTTDRLPTSAGSGNGEDGPGGSEVNSNDDTVGLDGGIDSNDMVGLVV